MGLARLAVPVDASPGTHELRCRAWDTDGNVQPAEPEWNVAATVNNAAQLRARHGRVTRPATRTTTSRDVS